MIRDSKALLKEMRDAAGAERDALLSRVRALEAEVSKHEHIEASETAEWKQRCAELEQDKARLDWLASKAADYPPSVFYWTREEIDSRMASERIAATNPYSDK